MVRHGDVKDAKVALYVTPELAKGGGGENKRERNAPGQVRRVLCVVVFVCNSSRVCCVGMREFGWFELHKHLIIVCFQNANRLLTCVCVSADHQVLPHLSGAAHHGSVRQVQRLLL